MNRQTVIITTLISLNKTDPNSNGSVLRSRYPRSFAMDVPAYTGDFTLMTLQCVDQGHFSTISGKFSYIYHLITGSVGKFFAKKENLQHCL